MSNNTVTVPREPTPEMLHALRTGSFRDYPSDELCRVRYAAAIAAAPQEQPRKDVYSTTLIERLRAQLDDALRTASMMKASAERGDKEIERLRAELAELRSGEAHGIEKWRKLLADRDAQKEEIEALKLDLRGYMTLCNEQPAEPVNLPAWVEQHAETFVSQYNDVYCDQRRVGIGFRDAERKAMKELLLLALGCWMAEQPSRAAKAEQPALESVPRDKPVAWMDDFGNSFPLAANKGAGSWRDEHKRNWKPLYTSPFDPQEAMRLADEYAERREHRGEDRSEGERAALARYLGAKT